MRASYQFASGNAVTVSYGGDGLRMEWMSWPPKQADVLEWCSVRHDLIARVLPPGVRFAIVDEDSLGGGCRGCDDA